jgi:hypothetical protein
MENIQIHRSEEGMSKYASSLTLKFLIGIAGVFLLSACNGGSAPNGTETQVEQPTQAPQIIPQVVLPTTTSTALPTVSESGYPEPQLQDGYPSPEFQDPEPASPTSGYPSPEEGLAATVPALKTEMQATNPSTVSLASGDIQLVEFFAFW